eukprot:2683853-Pyramimonas_sp.AAC.1
MEVYPTHPGTDAGQDDTRAHALWRPAVTVRQAREEGGGWTYAKRLNFSCVLSFSFPLPSVPSPPVSGAALSA